jgi:hypothetical protein
MALGDKSFTTSKGPGKQFLVKLSPEASALVAIGAATANVAPTTFLRNLIEQWAADWIREHAAEIHAETERRADA